MEQNNRCIEDKIDVYICKCENPGGSSRRWVARIRAENLTEPPNSFFRAFFTSTWEPKWEILGWRYRIAPFSRFAIPAFVFTCIVYGQIDRANLNGTVTDTSGAVIPKARSARKEVPHSRTLERQLPRGRLQPVEPRDSERSGGQYLDSRHFRQDHRIEQPAQAPVDVPGGVLSGEAVCQTGRRIMRYYSL